jgi:hypothetical protein
MSTISASTTTTTAFKVTSDTTGTLVLQTGSTPTTAVTIDTSGNFGLGVVPSAWATYPALQVNRGSLWGPGSSFYSSANLYFDGTNRRYIASSYASEYEQASGQHIWFNAPSGTAGNVVTLTQAMTLDASGNLGIGTSSPAAKLHVQGAVGSLAALFSDATNYTLAIARSGATGSVGMLYGTSGSSLALGANGSEAARIDTSGNLGIGTTTVVSGCKLNVSGGINSTNGALNFSGNGGFYNAANKFGVDNYVGASRFYSSGANSSTKGSYEFHITDSVGTLDTIAMTLDGLGTLGVGITPNTWGGGGKAIQLPGGALSGYSGASNNQTILWNNCYYGSNFTYINTDYANYFRMYNGDYAWFNAPSGTAGTTPTFTQVMTLDKSGNLLVGTTSNPDVARLYVRYDTLTTQPVIMSVTKQSASTSWNHFVGQSGNGTIITTNNIFIRGNGNIENVNNSYGAISDAKLKENVTDATPKLNQLQQVRVVNYNLIGEPDNKQIGVVAQELEQVFPAMVSESADIDANGNDLGTTTKSVKYSVFVPMLIKAIQELKAEFDAYKASHP